MAASQTTKICNKCKTELHVSLFSKTRTSKDGLQEKCKKCCNEYARARYLENRDKLCAKQREYAVANKDKKRESGRRYRKANIASILEYAKNYRESNKEKVSKYKIKWYFNNKERISEQRSKRYRDDQEVSNAVRKRAKEWAANNPELARIHRRNRRAKIRNVAGKLSKDIVDRLFKLQRGKCACCGEPLGDKYQLDHIMPIALGGANVDSNIQLLLAECNNFKRAKHPVDFMLQRGFLV